MVPISTYVRSKLLARSATGGNLAAMLTRVVNQRGQGGAAGVRTEGQAPQGFVQLSVRIHEAWQDQVTPAINRGQRIVRRLKARLH